jgi:hypothetical protein
MSITVYYVDPVRVVYGEPTNDDETRTEAKWAIERNWASGGPTVST